MDDDGNKQLNEEEFVKGLHDQGLEISEEEAKEIFERFDADGSGGINVDEFIVALRVIILIYIIPSPGNMRKISRRVMASNKMATFHP